MRPCPSAADFARFVDGALPFDETQSVQAHIATCGRCRAQDEALRILIADLKAPVRRELDVRAHVRAVMAHLDGTPAGIERSRRTPLLVGASSLGAAALLVAVCAGVLGSPTATVSWQARGGGSASGAMDRDVGVRPYGVEGGLRPLADGAVIGRATPLTAGFRNVGHAPAFLLLFAVDARDAVHWITPAYERPGDRPAATSLPAAPGEQLLPTTAVLEGVAAGPLRIIAVVTPTAARVSEVETLGPRELTAAGIARRFAGASVRETVVQVRDGQGVTP